MLKRLIYSTLSILLIVTMTSCNSSDQLYSTKEILVTSESGNKIAVKDNISFMKGKPTGNIIEVDSKKIKQTIDGIGTSFTESSAFVLAHLEREKRREVMEKVYGEGGANFSLTRTHIGACDFSIDGKYSYLDKKGDVKLESFTLNPDKEGFSKSEYSGIVDEAYDLLPMIKEALEIKRKQNDSKLRIIASAWTAPSWMKDIEEWYISGSAENNWQGTGGSLKPKYVDLYADYLIKYIDSYKEEGVDIWGITPVNEPHGNSGQWESMHFTPETQNEFIKENIGPKLQASDYSDTKVLIYDQNRDGLEDWTDVIYADSETAQFVYGAAIHWYESTFKVNEDVLNRVNKKFPEYALVQTEGCIDDLGKPAYPGIGDPEDFQESGWFDNDEFWWNENATDWAYTAGWAGDMQKDHPKYTPVHRYARNVIVSLNNWVTGWVDWNIVLDQNGGPNHVGNFCGAPIMIDTNTKQVYYTPIYYVLAQFSKTIRPGDKAVLTNKILDGLDNDALHASATINQDDLLCVQLLNTTKENIKFNLQLGTQYAEIEIEANSVQTVTVQL